MRAKGDTDRHDDDERRMKGVFEGSGVWGGAVAWLLGSGQARETM